jgi:hypothetical protein
MAAWLPGSQGSHGTMVGPRAVSSGVISGLVMQDSRGLGEAHRLWDETSTTIFNQNPLCALQHPKHTVVSSHLCDHRGIVAVGLPTELSRPSCLHLDPTRRSQCECHSWRRKRHRFSAPRQNQSGTDRQSVLSHGIIVLRNLSELRSSRQSGTDRQSVLSHGIIVLRNLSELRSSRQSGTDRQSVLSHGIIVLRNLSELRSSRQSGPPSLS